MQEVVLEVMGRVYCNAVAGLDQMLQLVVLALRSDPDLADVGLPSPDIL